MGLLKKNLKDVRSNSLIVEIVFSWLDSEKFEGIKGNQRLQGALIEHKNDPLPNVRTVRPLTRA